MYDNQLGVCGLRQSDVVLMNHYLTCIFHQLIQVTAREAEMRGNFTLLLEPAGHCYCESIFSSCNECDHGGLMSQCSY